MTSLDSTQNFLDITTLVLSKFANSKRYKSAENINKIQNLSIRYEPSTNIFYAHLSDDDKFQKLNWQPQKTKTNGKIYDYAFVDIPYKRKNPIKILSTTGEKIRGSKFFLIRLGALGDDRVEEPQEGYALRSI
jgi:hypothetical protein